MTWNLNNINAKTVKAKGTLPGDDEIKENRLKKNLLYAANASLSYVPAYDLLLPRPTS